LVYADQRKFKKAIRSYQKSIQFQPHETYPYVFLATALSIKGKLKKAEKVLLERLKKEGDIDEVNYNLSLNYARQGKLKKAIKAMKDCIQIEPNYPGAKDFLEDFKNFRKKIQNNLPYI
jgi:predicted Zn-dependent protease